MAFMIHPGDLPSPPKTRALLSVLRILASCQPQRFPTSVLKSGSGCEVVLESGQLEMTSLGIVFV